MHSTHKTETHIYIVIPLNQQREIYFRLLKGLKGLLTLSLIILKPRHKVIQKNLFSLGIDLISQKKCSKICSSLYSNLAEELFSLFFAPPLQVKIPHSFLKEIHTLKEQKAILLTGHLGNHEYLGQVLTQMGIPLQGFYQKQSSSFWNTLILKWRRKNGDYAPWEIREFPKAFRIWKNKPTTLGFLWDQHSRGNSPYTALIGTNTLKTHNLPLRLKAAHPPTHLLFAFLIREKEGYILKRKWGHSLEEFHPFYEELLRQHPDQWYGSMHKIFKDQLDY